MLWDSFLNKFDANFLLNVHFAYFVYSHRSKGMTSEHWHTAILFCSDFWCFAYLLGCNILSAPVFKFSRKTVYLTSRKTVYLTISFH